MRYHINDKGEVGKCEAKPGKCRFKKSNGDEKDHYASKEEAVKARDSILRKKYPSLTSHKKRTPPKKFIESRENIKKLLVDYNFKKDKELKNVNTIQEMVANWFDGDKAKYIIFRDLAKTNLNSNSKEAISKMLKGNIKVNITDKTNIDTKPNTIYSNIDIISESDNDFDKILLAQVRNKTLPPIKF